MTIKLAGILAILFFALEPSVFAGSTNQTSNQTAAAGPSVAELLAVIKSGADAIAKSAAINKLAAINAEDERNNRVVETLIEVTQTTTDYFVGKTAVRAITSLQKGVAPRAKALYLEPFTQLLREAKTPVGIRSEIAQCFIETLDKDSANAMRLMAEIARNKAEGHLALRGKCLVGLGAAGSAEHLGVLCDCLSDADNYIRESATLALLMMLNMDPGAAKNVTPATVNKLIDTMKDERVDVEQRINAIGVIGKLIGANVQGAAKAVDDLIRMVNEEKRDAMVHAAIGALSVTATPQAVDALIRTYQDYSDSTNMLAERDLPVRVAVAKTMIPVLSVLASRPNPDAETVPKVVDFLKKILRDDPSILVKEAGIVAIVSVASEKLKAQRKEVVSVLIELLDKKPSGPVPAESQFRVQVVDALEAITHVNFGQNVKRWREWFAEHYK